MNIALVTPFHVSDTGGVCTVIKMLYTEFAKMGHRVTIIGPGATTQVAIVPTSIDGMSIYGLYLRRPFVRGAVVRGFIAFWVRLPFTLYGLWDYLKRNEIEIVAIQYPLPQMFYFGLLRLVCFWKLVLTFQGNDAHDLPVCRIGERFFLQCLLKTADRITAVSQSLLKEVQRVFPNIQMNTAVICNGAPISFGGYEKLESLPAGVPDDYILTVGQLIKRKGIDILIDALRITKKRGFNLQVVVVGDGPERLNLLRLAREIGVAENLSFVGNQEYEVTLECFKKCSFFVLASRAEGMPLVIAEALSMGKAVVATRIDGVPELVEHGVNGLLVPPESAGDLAEALISLNENPEFRDELASRGRDKILRSHTWKTIAEQYLELFRKELERKHKNKTSPVSARDTGEAR
jgi:glycosyltransferase involved in cell wall biosynthesis